MQFHFFFFFFIIIVEGGIELKLIHRDSPLSPLYNHSESSEERARDATLRSLTRLNQISTNGTSFEFTIHPGVGEYLVDLYIGSTPTKISLILDTGSDIIWTQCTPCFNCYSQHRPLYDYRKSSTYRSILCDEPLCRLSLTLAPNNCSSNSSCNYLAWYADGSTSRGILATEKFNFQMVEDGVHEAAFTGVVFGCGEENDLFLSGGGTSGILGLSEGNLSFISQFSQLGSNAGRIFSYCLPKSADYTGNLKFGLTSHSSDRVVSTPLLTNEIHTTHYYVYLEGITVGRFGKKIAYKQVPSRMSNTLVDPSIALNFIDPELYNDLIPTLKQMIGLQTVEDPELFYSLCYSGDSKIPEQTLVFHFSGADVELKNINMFIQVNGMICFSMASSQRASYNLYGNIAQKGFELEYNLESMILSFAPAKCSQNPIEGAGARSYSNPLLSTLEYITLIFIHVLDISCKRLF